MGRVIAVVSGKGGTGKTSFCGGVGSSLAALGYRVLCLDMDLGLKNLDITLGMTEDAIMDFTDVLSGRSSLADAAVEHPGIPGLFLLTSPLSASAEMIDDEDFRGLTEEIRSCFDYCLIDAPAGLGPGFRLAAAPADIAVIVTTADKSSRRGAALAGGALSELGILKSYLVVGRVSPKLMVKIKTTIDDIMDTVGLPLLGIVPEDTAVIQAGSVGTPLLLFRRRQALKAYANIARRISGQRVPLMKIR